MPSGLSTAKYAMLSAHDEEGFLLAKTEEGRHHRRTRDALVRAGLVREVKFVRNTIRLDGAPETVTRHQITDAGRAVLREFS